MSSTTTTTNSTHSSTTICSRTKYKMLMFLLTLLNSMSMIMTVAAVVPFTVEESYLENDRKRKFELLDRPVMENICRFYLGKPQQPLPY